VDASIYGQPRTPFRPPVENPVKSFVPEDVADHYLSLTVDELITDVFRCYRGMWPGIKSLITEHASNQATDPLILEGFRALASLRCYVAPR